MKIKTALLVVGLLFCATACGKDEIVFEECNTIFTESYFEEIQEIVYWNGDAQHVIDDKKKKEFFATLSSLELTEMLTPEVGELLIGGTSIEFVTEEGSRRITVLSGEIRIDGIFYEIDKDILDELREIAFGKE